MNLDYNLSIWVLIFRIHLLLQLHTLIQCLMTLVSSLQQQTQDVCTTEQLELNHNSEVYCTSTCGPTTPPGPGGPVFPWKP